MQNRNWHKEDIVSIDFDGVLSEYNGWQGEEITGKPIHGAKEFVINLIDSGYKPVIFTARKIEVVSAWLKKFDFPDIEVTNTKYPSVVYIDDRCVQFDGNFTELVKKLKDYDVYWRKKDYKCFDKLKTAEK